MTIQQTMHGETVTILTATGVLQCEEIIHALTEFADQGITPGLLWDFTEADLSQISRADIDRIVAFVSSNTVLVTERKVAFLAPSDLAFGLSRMYEALLSLNNRAVRRVVCRDKNEAIDWLMSAD